MITIHTLSSHNTADADLGAHAAKATSIEGNQTEAAVSVWVGGTGDKIDTGLWECTAGVFTAERIGYTEICTILSGRVTLEVEGAEPEEFGPGDIMVMPSGWKGVWRVHEPLRKHYTTIND